MIVALQYSLFFLIISTFGKLSYSRLIKNNKSNEFFTIPVSYFYPIIGLFVVGNLTVLLNFFLPIGNKIKFVILFVILLNSKKLFKNFSFNKINFLNIFNTFVLSLSSYDTGLAYDATLYHLNNQKWILDSKIVIGLSNLHDRFGYQSIIEYINVNFWMENNFLYLHFVSLIFLNVLFNILGFFILKGNSKYFLIASTIALYGFLDNFGFNGGKNGYFEIEAIGKQDTAFAILVFLVCVVIFQKSKDIHSDEFLFISLLVIFCIQLRVTGYLLIPILLILFFKNKHMLTYRFGYLIFFYVLWLVKNVFTTSCLAFPIYLSCISSLDWHNSNLIKQEYLELQEFHRSFSNYNSLDIWIESWTENVINQTVLFNFTITLSIIVLFLIMFFRFRASKEALLNISFSLFLIIFWIYTGPTIRFGVGFIMAFVASLTLFFNEPRVKNKMFTYAVLICLVSNLILLNKITNYFNFLDNPVLLIEKNAKTIEYTEEKEKYYGVFPKSGAEACWINKKCVVTKENILNKEKYGFKIFTIED